MRSPPEEIEIDENEDGVSYDPIWLDQEEWAVEDLPFLLTGSSRRKKTMDSLFPHLSNKLYRCREFPGGIYINQYGELCPNDPRSGLYRLRPPPQDGEVPAAAGEEEVEDDEDSDNDNRPDPDDEYWQQQEQKLQGSRKRRRSEQEDGSESDDDYVPENEESEDELKTVEEEEDDDDGEEEEDYPSDPEHEEGDEEDHDDEDFKTAADDVGHISSMQTQWRHERVRSQKLLQLLETYLERWKEIRKHKGRHDKNDLISIACEPRFHCSQPSCEFTFKKKGRQTEITGDLNCATHEVQCECGLSATRDMSVLYEHIQSHFVVDLNG